jgi:PAS domain S-box-containing protein
MLARRRDGTKFHVEISLSLLEAGAEILVLGAIRDIERKRTEELNVSAIVEACSDAIIGKTLDGTIVSWNKGAEKIYGYKAEEILERSIAVLMPHGQSGELSAIMKQVRRGKQIENFETIRVHKDGHLIDVSVTISPVRNKAGKVGGAAVIARDITRQKQAEAALRLSEERLRVALKNASVIVFTQDLKLRYTWINSPFLNWKSPAVAGHTDAEIVGGPEGKRLTAIKEKVLRTGVGSHTEADVTFEGETHCIDLVVEPLRDDGGTIIGLISSAIDTTPWKSLVARLQGALDQVQLLSGLLSICASCKRIRDEHAIWQPLEGYIQAHSEAKFTHGLCPDCMRKLYPDYHPQSL